MDDIAQNKDKLSKVSVWAFSIGTAIGWGSFVVTTNTYLKTAGVAGSIIALLIGAAIMLVISRNYHFLMNRFANMGGIFTFTSETLGADFGFTSTWFLVLTYLSIFWANATSLPLFTKYLFGNVLKFGIKYTIFGYTIYINEAFLSISAILLTGLGCIHIRKLLSKINVALVFLFTLAITFCTAFCLLSKRNDFVLAPNSPASQAHCRRFSKSRAFLRGHSLALKLFLMQLWISAFQKRTRFPFSALPF